MHPSSSLQRGRHKKAFLYRQVADELRKQIVAGKLAPGDRLPSMDELATTYAITKLTVRRALQELRAEGVITISPARGSFVATAAPPRPAATGRAITVIGVISRVLVPGQTGHYHTEMLDALRQALTPLSASMLLLHCADEPGHLARVVCTAHMDAAIFIGPFDPSELRQVIDHGPPAVVLDFLPRALAARVVAIDNYDGGQQALAHLLALGHRDVGIIAGSPDQTATVDRLAGAHEALRQAGIDPATVPVVNGEFRTDAGRRALLDLLARPRRPTAVFCMNDEMALGALQALQDHHFNVPGDISLLGFDDIALCRSVSPQLTTVAVPLRQLARQAVQSLREGLEQGDRAAARTVLSCTLVVRDSTAAPKAR